MTENMNEDFTFRNRSIQIWLTILAISGVPISIVFPPSFWVCFVRAFLLVIGQLINSARTDQWYSWQHEGSLNWFDGWVTTSGIVLIVIPLLTVLVRALPKW
jgi:hypothetical protein